MVKHLSTTTQNTQNHNSATPLWSNLCPLQHRTHRITTQLHPCGQHLSTTTQNTQNHNSATLLWSNFCPLQHREIRLLLCHCLLTKENSCWNRTNVPEPPDRSLFTTVHSTAIDNCSKQNPTDGLLPVTDAGTGDLRSNRWVLTCDSCRCWRHQTQKMALTCDRCRCWRHQT